MARTRRTAAPAPVEDDSVFEDIDVEDEPTPAPKPAKRSRAKATPEPKPAAAPKTPAGSGFDSNWLAEHASETLGRDVDSRTVRMAIRALAADGTIEREVGTDRSRYDFPKGANDPTVKAVLAKLKSGPAPRAPKTDDAPAAAPAKRTRKAAAPVEDAIEEIPAKPTRRRAPAKTAAPAKATPATAPRRRRSAGTA
jgi:hypothetical protein